MFYCETNIEFQNSFWRHRGISYLPSILINGRLIFLNYFEESQKIYLNWCKNWY